MDEIERYADLLRGYSKCNGSLRGSFSAAGRILCGVKVQPEPVGARAVALLCMYVRVQDREIRSVAGLSGIRGIVGFHLTSIDLASETDHAAQGSLGSAMDVHCTKTIRRLMVSRPPCVVVHRPCVGRRLMCCRSMFHPFLLCPGFACVSGADLAQSGLKEPSAYRTTAISR